MKIPYLFRSEEDASWTVEASLPVRYTIYEQDELFATKNRLLLNGALTQEVRPVRRFIVIDAFVYQLYGERIKAYFDYHHVQIQFFPLDITEDVKTLKAVTAVATALNDFGISRRQEPIIGIGGGVLLDIVGMVASLYRRGTPYVRIPTTLVAFVDAGVGIKTGINFDHHKNRLGTYYPPVMTLLDRTFLRSLDIRHICNGLAEVVKLAIMLDAPLFEILEQHCETLLNEKLQGAGAALWILRRSITDILHELASNLWEHNLERLVDFGHTFSPSLEMRALPSILHGEAVAIDMAISTQVAYARGLLRETERNRILRLLETLHLPLVHDNCTSSLLDKALQDALRHRDGQQRIPLPITIGSARFFNDITLEELVKALEVLRQW